MSSYTFAQLRLQFIEFADAQPGLTDRAFRLVLHLIVRHLNRTDGTCQIDDTSLASELGCSTDTISRAVACAERSGLLTVKCGRWLRPTHYSMSAQAWQAAEARRRITGKSAEQGAPQICGDHPAKQPSNTPQKSGAFYRNEIKEKSAGADAAPASVPSLPDEGLSGTAQVPTPLRWRPSARRAPPFPDFTGKDFTMRWIITVDHHGGCMGLGEDANGVPSRGNPEQGDTLPMDFRLHLAGGEVLFEGRCGDIDADWWHGFEPLNYLWQPFRCRRLSYRRAGTDGPWRWLRP